MNKIKKKITIEYIKEYVRKISPNVILLSEEYTNNKSQLKFKCECGNIFTKNWDTIQSKKTCKCRSCARKDGWKNNRRDKDFSRKSENIFLKHGFKPLEIITHSKDKILCIDDDGYKGRISLTNVRLGKHFGIFSIPFNKEYIIFNLNNYAQLNHVDTKVLGLCDNMFYDKTYDYKIKCICGCGEQFITKLGSFVTLSKWRCSKCTKKKSTLELKVDEYLNLMGIKYKSQHKFKDCLNPITNRPLFFDYYFQEYNLCIEVDGSQHYIKSKKFYRVDDDNIATKIFEGQRYRDNIKNKYCIHNKINLVRITYKDFRKDKYKEILYNLFNHSNVTN